jgi:hypothetical protein
VFTIDSLHEDAFGPEEQQFGELFAWLFASFM